MTGYLNDFINGNPTEYVPKKKLLDMGVDAVAPFDIPAQDRNRTSPFYIFARLCRYCNPL